MKPCTIIIPSSLTSVFVPAMKESDLDSTAVSQIFAASLTARGKHSPSQTWLRKWKKDFWMKPLFSQMSQLSRGSNSLHTWLEGFCLSDGHANQSQWQESEKPQKTSDGCLTLSQMEFPLCDQECYSQKMSKDSSQQKCQTDQASSDTASRDWSGYITKLRQEYSARLKSAHRTSASGSSSWPTARSRDWKDSGDLSQTSYGMTLGRMAQQEEKNWLTPATVQIQRQDMQKRIDYRASIGRKYVPGSLEEQMQHHGRADQANSNTHGNHQGLWRTPSVAEEKNQNSSTQIYLQNQVGATPKAWATPQASDHIEGARTELTSNQKCLGRDMKQWATATVSTGAHRQKDGSMTPKLDRQVSGKLNPRWVETLMGLPVGWTSPSCPASVIKNWPKFVSGWCAVTTEPTNSDSLETAAFQPQYQELF